VGVIDSMAWTGNCNSDARRAVVCVAALVVLLKSVSTQPDASGTDHERPDLVLVPAVCGTQTTDGDSCGEPGLHNETGILLPAGGAGASGYRK
jgi:hypothetical protein